MNQLDTKMLKQGLFLTAVSYALSRLLIGNLLFTIPLMVLAPKFSNRREAGGLKTDVKTWPAEK